ncbi:RNA-directed DNA polymerase from mobile element jockey [Caerostris extrusa]|uniref:RNA-directed DNA polymerase from mobile element jockey n=1 Tax=Caerostris extrusa TaxID=172846 RepID=A0AAV4M443_CAEEX|nr:RNA-directed DNA polymerase from mobile element jockey [Caerostris extrusa]
MQLRNINRLEAMKRDYTKTPSQVIIEAPAEEYEKEDLIETPTIDEVQDIIDKSKNHKAAGPDEISPELIKYGGKKLTRIIYEIIILIWEFFVLHMTVSTDPASVTVMQLLALLDVAKAFDKVWIDGLLYKLINYNFPNYLINILFHYLTDRQFVTRISKQFSSPHVIQAGVPQGSLLGPVLHNIYVSDIP